MTHIDTLAEVYEAQPPEGDRGGYTREGKLRVTLLLDEPGHVHVMVSKHGEVQSVALDEPCARTVAAALLAPFEPPPRA